jgi:uncharacterized repeat protein (TIGR03806 family)
MIPSGVQITRAFPNLTFNLPMLLIQAPQTPGRVYVMERAGVVKSFPNMDNAMPNSVTEIINISGRVNGAGEGGLLGMAFHPQWPARRELFLSYTRTGNPLISVIARFKPTVPNAETFDPASEERLLEVNQPFSNHNGGGIAFGRDGFLYIGLGDGGSGDDPNNAGQNLNTNLGKFLRIDVNVPANQRYAIPPTNPFANGTVCNNGNLARETGNPNTTRCAEIFASGFRNPWRWSFDIGTGDLWAGDVGQGAWEEVDIVTNGGNYGWKLCEGFYQRGSTNTRCTAQGVVAPVVNYGRGVGISITGGYVYRGTTIPGLVGRFVFGDYDTGRIMAVQDNPTTGERTIEELVDTNLKISSFGQTLDGEVYVLNLPGGDIQKLTPSGMAMPSTFPQRLSQTGCFDAADVKRPGPMLIPYDLNSPLWSDGAEKERFFAIPDGTKIQVTADGDFDFPNGTVTIKTFSIGNKRIETRLFMKHPDGQWAGYSYEWRDDQSDADLLPAAKTKEINGQTWLYPSRSQCLNCHTASAGRSVGLELAQLNRDFVYPRGVVANQVSTLNSLGMFSAALPAMLPRLEPYEGNGPIEARARSYLHSNCSVCHRNAMGQGPQDFRYSLTLSQMNVCNTMPTNGSLGINGARLLAPGMPAQSLISVRMKALNTSRMPPLASSVVHPQGTALIDQWITATNACP